MISSEVRTDMCERFQRVASAWLRSGEITRTNHLLSPMEELAGFNYGFVYLLEVQANAVKVGYSEHPMRRIRELRPLYGDALKLRSCFVGEQKKERELHQRFAHLRIEYELFLPSEAIVAAFAQERERVRARLGSLHICEPTCPQLVKNLDVRILRTWLRR